MIPPNIPPPPNNIPPPQENAPPPPILPNLPEAPVVIRPTELEQQLASMDFLQSVVQKNGFGLLDVYDFTYSITSLDRAPGKDHLQGTVRREFTCMAGGRTQKFIIEQKINVSIRVPDLKYMDEQTVQETKMKALFAIDGHEFKLQNAFRIANQTGVNKQIEALKNKTLMTVYFRREATNKGFYGKAIRWEKKPWPKGITNKIAHALSYHGSIKGAVVDDMDTTNVWGYKAKWAKFNEIPCPILETRRTQLDKIINDITTLTEAPQFNITQFLRNIEEFPEGEDKQKLDLIKQQLFPGNNGISTHEMLSTLEREINHKADELKLQLTADRWDQLKNTQTISTVSHKDIGAGFGKYTTAKAKELKRINEMILQLGDNPPPEQQERLQQLIEARTSVENTLLPIIQKQERALQRLMQLVHTMEFLLTCCKELVQSNELKIHQENCDYLKKLIQNTQLSERVAGIKTDLIQIVGRDFITPAPPPPTPQYN